jgi:hypothetical protein
MSRVSKNKKEIAMRYRILCGCVLFALVVAMASAQTKATFTGKCSKPDIQQSVTIPDQPGHAFTLAQGKCTTTMGEIGGAKSKEGAFSEHGEVMGTRMKNSGVYVETYDSGDKVYYTYQTTGTTKDGAFQGGSNKYQITGGTGKMKGIKGSGSCKLTGAADGGLDYSCAGEYTLAGAAAAKQ